MLHASCDNGNLILLVAIAVVACVLEEICVACRGVTCVRWCWRVLDRGIKATMFVLTSTTCSLARRIVARLEAPDGKDCKDQRSSRKNTGQRPGQRHPSLRETTR